MSNQLAYIDGKIMSNSFNISLIHIDQDKTSSHEHGS